MFSIPNFLIAQNRQVIESCPPDRTTRHFGIGTPPKDVNCAEQKVRSQKALFTQISFDAALATLRWVSLNPYELFVHERLKFYRGPLKARNAVIILNRHRGTLLNMLGLAGEIAEDARATMSGYSRLSRRAKPKETQTCRPRRRNATPDYGRTPGSLKLTLPAPARASTRCQARPCRLTRNRQRATAWHLPRG